MLLLCGAFSELGAHYQTLLAMVNRVYSPLFRRHSSTKLGKDHTIVDPAPPHEQVPWWMWTGGLLLSVIFTCAVLGAQYHVPVGISILAIIAAFILSLIGSESAGRTDINPITSIGNATQLILGGAVRRYHYSVPRQQLVSLSGAMIAQAATEQSVSMVSDLKTTHLLRASPRIQFYAQLIGSIVCIFMGASMYVLFSTAYPCINDLALQDQCSFSIPDVGAYRAIAIAVTSPKLPIPPSSGYTAIGLGVFAVLVTIIKYRLVPAKYHVFVPNPVGMGIAFILNTQVYATAMAFGATLGLLWYRRNPAGYATYCYAVAAGMVAGEGLGGIVGAVLEIAKVSGSYRGTKVGCPGTDYCR